MHTDVIVAIIGLCGSAIGSLIGIILNTKLTTYRIAQLEKKVDKHNSLIERTYDLEEKEKILEAEQRYASNRIDKLERKRGV